MELAIQQMVKDVLGAGTAVAARRAGGGRGRGACQGQLQLRPAPADTELVQTDAESARAGPGVRAVWVEGEAGGGWHNAVAEADARAFLVRL